MIRRHPHVFGEESLKYLPEEYLNNFKKPVEAPEKAPDSGQPETREDTLQGDSESQRSFNGILIDWKQIKSYEKKGREWEEDYLFKAFDEAEELISVARKRKLDKKT